MIWALTGDIAQLINSLAARTALIRALRTVVPISRLVSVPEVDLIRPALAVVVCGAEKTQDPTVPEARHEAPLVREVAPRRRARVPLPHLMRLVPGAAQFVGDGGHSEVHAAGLHALVLDVDVDGEAPAEERRAGGGAELVDAQHVHSSSL
eukprot:gene9197-biopygen12317